MLPAGSLGGSAEGVWHGAVLQVSLTWPPALLLPAALSLHLCALRAAAAVCFPFFACVSSLAWRMPAC